MLDIRTDEYNIVLTIARRLYIVFLRACLVNLCYISRCGHQAFGCIFCGSGKDSGAGLAVIAFWVGLLVYCLCNTVRRCWRWFASPALPSAANTNADDRGTAGQTAGVAP
jgi:hypothetical protein